MLKFKDGIVVSWLISMEVSLRASSSDGNSPKLLEISREDSLLIDETDFGNDKIDSRLSDLKDALRKWTSFSINDNSYCAS